MSNDHKQAENNSHENTWRPSMQPSKGAPIPESVIWAIINVVTSRWVEVGAAPRGHMVDVDGARSEIRRLLEAVS